MKLTIPKNINIPLLISVAVGTMLALIFGMYFMNRMVQDTYLDKIQEYEVVSEKTTDILKKGIEDNCKALQVTALLLGEQGELDKAKMLDILPMITESSQYIDMAIANLDGIGYDTEGLAVDFSKEDFLLSVKEGKSSIMSRKEWKDNTEPVLIYNVPIHHKDNQLGMLIAIQSAAMTNISSLSLEQLHKDSAVIYMMDANKNLLFHFNDDKLKGFNYAEISAISNPSGNDLEPRKIFHLKDYLLLSYTKKHMTVWYEKPLGLNNWSVLVGRSYVLDSLTMSIVMITNHLLILILSFMVLLFIGLAFNQRRSNKKLTQMIYLDPVTGGGNWYKFRNDANKILNSRQSSRKNHALVNFDINRFKLINDSFGHQKGDEVLRDIYHVIKKWVNIGEPYTRYSADQYYILLNFQTKQELSDRINDLNEYLHQLKYIKAVKFYFGVYFITEKQDSIDRMGDFACIAKHSIKGSNEDIIAYFDDNSRKKLLEEEHIEKNMYDALQKEEFMVYLQPKYAVQREKIIGAEALVRWNSGTDNLILPAFFIPLFEKNGFIIQLDMYMLRKVCQIQRDWLDKGYIPMPVSVNISRLHFANAHLAEAIRDAVDEYQVPHELIELELSESAFLQNKQMLINTVILLREYGFLVSMDDFGAGYSSLNSLKDIPLDIVKLDGELFRITEEVERGYTVIRNTISMAKDLHMKVVAECIETREQVEFLCSVGCDIIQGYYYAKPMSVDQFESRYLSGLQSYRNQT